MSNGDATPRGLPITTMRNLFFILLFLFILAVAFNGRALPDELLRQMGIESRSPDPLVIALACFTCMMLALWVAFASAGNPGLQATIVIKGHSLNSGPIILSIMILLMGVAAGYFSYQLEMRKDGYRTFLEGHVKKYQELVDRNHNEGEFRRAWLDLRHFMHVVTNHTLIELECGGEWDAQPISQDNVILRANNKKIRYDLELGGAHIQNYVGAQFAVDIGTASNVIGTSGKWYGRYSARYDELPIKGTGGLRIKLTIGPDFASLCQKPTPANDAQPTVVNARSGVVLEATQQ